MQLATLLLLLVVVVTSNVASAAYCHGAPSPNATANTQPIYLNVQPKFVAAIKNGKLFSVEQGMVKLNLIHVYGSAYEVYSVKNIYFFCRWVLRMERFFAVTFKRFIKLCGPTCYVKLKII